MHPNGSEVWLVSCETYRLPGQSIYDAIPLEIAIVNLRNGATIVSTKVDYGNATPQEMFKRISGLRHCSMAPGLYKAFANAFERQYNGRRTSGMRPSQIEQVMREKGFHADWHKLISYRGPPYSIFRILTKDDEIARPRDTTLDWRRVEVLPEISLWTLVNEMCNCPGDFDTGVIHERLFGDQRYDTLPNAETEAKSLLKICSRLHPVLMIGLQ
ncbi:hypothetical protein IWX90DRAFT_313679 [Phyllosticta citrichinensis]|uniref:Uncharacterized protein n=1 Tax=Phyllosticta citrichinensis TaxID=1130410 RepID=A0ABR1XM03_9PEZI